MVYFDSSRNHNLHRCLSIFLWRLLCQVKCGSKFVSLCVAKAVGDFMQIPPFTIYVCMYVYIYVCIYKICIIQVRDLRCELFDAKRMQHSGQAGQRVTRCQLLLARIVKCQHGAALFLHCEATCKGEASKRSA